MAKIGHNFKQASTVTLLEYNSIQSNSIVSWSVITRNRVLVQMHNFFLSSERVSFQNYMFHTSLIRNISSLIWMLLLFSNSIFITCSKAIILGGNIYIVLEL